MLYIRLQIKKVTFQFNFKLLIIISLVLIIVLLPDLAFVDFFLYLYIHKAYMLYV